MKPPFPIGLPFLHLPLLAVVLLCALAPLRAEADPPAPFGAVPSQRQLRRQAMRICAFLHFTVNTFTDREWGHGDEDPNVFNPTEFDPDGIVSALKEAGVEGVILTCKHHDGFCLWPTKATDHSVAHSSWMGGKGDVVRAISDACRRHGLKFGIYLSPWDRNNAEYARPGYLKVYHEQLHELLTQYGPLFEVWFDGANGGDGYYGGARETRKIPDGYYGFPEIAKMVRKLQPNAVMFGGGDDLRWVGNEDGYANDTCWATVGNGPWDAATGNVGGDRWMPAECDVSIRPGWFWHARENGQVKSPAKLFSLYCRSVGHGALMLLNIPPDRRGKLCDADLASLRGFHEILRRTFAVNLAKGAKLTASNVRSGDPAYGPENLLKSRGGYWATDDGVATPSLVLETGREVSFNVVELQEKIALGQRIEEFALDRWSGGAWEEFARGTSVGSCRLVRLPESVTTSRVRLRIEKSGACIALSRFGLYLKPAEQ
jgi:alpha-L-fucosidase